MTDADLIEAVRNGDVLFVTVAELVPVSRMSKMKIYRHIHDGSLEAIRFGRGFRIPVKAAREFLDNGVDPAGASQSCEGRA